MAAGPNDTVAFIPASTQADSSFGREQSALMDTVDTLLLGRVTYKMFVDYWPNVTDGAKAKKEFTDKFNSLSKVIFSKSLERAPWGKWTDASRCAIARRRGHSVRRVVGTLTLQSRRRSGQWRPDVQ